MRWTIDYMLLYVLNIDEQLTVQQHQEMDVASSVGDMIAARRLFYKHQPMFLLYHRSPVFRPLRVVISSCKLVHVGS